MNIRQKENDLFETWIRERPLRNPFVKDGCHSPQDYAMSKHKVVFLLKEPNWGYSQVEQEKYATEETDVHDQRDGYDDWWKTIGKWCATITNPQWNWLEIEKNVNSGNVNEFIAPYVMVQLKKSPGGGSSVHDKLGRIAKEDKSLLLSQLSIYQPKYIVSCGLWSISRNELFNENRNIHTAPNGIEYYFASDKDANLNNVCIVNFCHPSMRCSSVLNGAVSFALKDAITFISETLNSNV